MPRLTLAVAGVSYLCVALGCGGIKNGHDEDGGAAVAPAVPESRAPEDSGVPDPASLCGIDGCPGTCIGSPSCKMPDGCPGLRECLDGVWGPCEWSGTGSLPCTECGVAGTRACTVNGPSSECVSPGRSCTCGTYSGTRTCNASTGQWSTCSGGWTGTGCVNSAGCGGSVACDASGTPVCNLYGAGTRGSNTCTTTRGKPGHLNCNSVGQALGCQPDDPAQRYEDCNNLDDDGDGVIDNQAGSTAARSLTAGCTRAANADPACTASGGYTCPNGAWVGSCTWSGSVPCVHPCKNTPSIKPCQNYGVLGSCLAPTETCNGLDDNCDGQIDESNVCLQGGSCK